MGRKKKKKTEEIKPQSESSSERMMDAYLKDPQMKRYALYGLLALALPLVAFFITTGDTDGIYITVMLACSAGILLWAFPNLILGLTGVFLFTQPLLIYLANTDYNYTKMIYSLLFIGVLLILWCILWLRSNKAEIDLSRLLLPGVLLLVSAILSLVNSRVFLADFQHVVYFVYFIFFYIFLVNLLKSENDIKLLLRVVVLAGVGASIYGLLQYFGLALGKPGADNGTSAVISTFGNKNYMAGFLSYIFVPGLLLFYKSAGVGDRIYALIALSLFTLALLTATSESAWLALLLSMGALLIGLWSTGEIKEFGSELGWGILFSFTLIFSVVLFLLLSAFTIYDSAIFFSSMAQAYGTFSTPAWVVVGVVVFLPMIGWVLSLFAHHFKRAVGIVAVGSIVVIGLLISPIGSGVVSDLTHFLSQNTVMTRAQDWWVGYEMFEDHPIVGTGVGDYKREFLEYKDDFLASPQGQNFDGYIRRAAQAHNEYVQITAEMGLLGLLVVLAFIIFVFALFISRLRSAESSGQRWVLTALFAGFVAFLVDAFFSFPLHLPANSLALVLILGALFSRALGGPGLKLALPQGAAVAVLSGVVLVVGTVSVFAYRDWKGDIALDRGRFLYQIERDFDGAEERLEENVNLAFSAGETYYWLGVINYQRSRETQNPTELVALRTKSDDYFERSIAPFLTESTYFYLAVMDQERRDYEASLEHVDQLLALDPSPDLLPDILQLQAVNIYNLGDVDAGLSQLEELIDIYPKEPGIYLTLSRMYEEQWSEQSDDAFCTAGREIIAQAQTFIQTRLARLDQLINPEEDTNVSYNRYFSWQSEHSTLKGLEDEFERMLTRLRC